MLVDYAEIPEKSWINIVLKGGVWKARLVLPNGTEVKEQDEGLFEVVDNLHLKYTAMEASSTASAEAVG